MSDINDGLDPEALELARLETRRALMSGEAGTYTAADFAIRAYLTASQPSRDAVIEEALIWYGEEATSLASRLSGMTAEDAVARNSTAVLAILTEISLDAGRRAAKALAALKSPADQEKSNA